MKKSWIMCEKRKKEHRMSCWKKKVWWATYLPGSPGMINLSSWQHTYGNNDRKGEEMRHNTYQLEQGCLTCGAGSAPQII